MNSQERYSLSTESLADDRLMGRDEEQSFLNEPCEKPRAFKRYRSKVYILLAIGVISCFGLFGVFFGRKTPAPGWLECGNTPAQAKANNCHYEPMQRSWIPDACYFDEPNDEYTPFDDREWYEDEALSQPADLDKLRNGDDYMVFTKYFHNEHCLYAWRKMAIAIERHYPMVDTKTYDLHHTTHCARLITTILVDAAQPDYVFNNETYTSSPLMFQGCVPLPWDEAKVKEWFSHST